MDQGLAWMIASLVSITGGTGFYYWALYMADEKNTAMIAAGSEPTPGPEHKAEDKPENKPEQKQEPDQEQVQEPHNKDHPQAHPKAPGKINAALPAPWNYQGSTGPRYWNRLDPAYLDCGSVRGQSPIDLDNTKIDVKLKPVVFNYRDSNVVTTLRGQDLLATVSGDNFIEIEGDRYHLHSISIHTPSEHQLQSVPYELEIQLNHRSAAGDLAVVAVFVAAGDANQDLQLLLASLPRGDRDERELSGFPLMKLLPKKRTYFHYTGSQTTPPCTGNVAWYVFTTAMEASSRDIERAVRLVINNSRPLQKAAGRGITRSNR